MAVIRFWIIVIIVVLFLIGISILLSFKFKKRPFIKYIPTLVTWLLSIVLFLLGHFYAQPMQDLGFYLMSMIAGLATFITMTVTLVFSKYLERKK